MSCPHCLESAVYKGFRGRGLTSLFGAVDYSRGYYHCPACQRCTSPLDGLLGLREHDRTPAVQNAATIVVTSVRSLRGHQKKGAVDFAILRSWGPFLVAGSILGVLAASQLKSTTLQAVFGVLAGIAGLYMAFGRPEWRLGPQMPGQPTAGVMGVVLAFCSTLMGIGGGTFGVPLMTLYGLPIHRAVGTASGFGILISVPSVLGFLLLSVADAPPYTLGAVNLVAFAIIIPMTLLTTPLGVRLAHAMNPAPLKRAFAIFLVLVAANMIRKVLGW